MATIRERYKYDTTKKKKTKMNTMNSNRLTEAEMDRRYAELENGVEMPISRTMRDKCKGAIFGTIVGDALFQPIEFSSKLGHPWIDRMTYGKVWGIPAGCYTDDSSMMLCIMQGFLDDPDNYHVRNVANAFLRWMDDGLWSATGNCFDIGCSCSAGLNAFRRTGSVVNGSPSSRGCGGIMRFSSSWMVARKVGSTDKERMDAMLAINDIDHHNNECDDAIREIAGIFDDHILRNRRTEATSIYSNWRAATGSGNAFGCLETALWAFNTTRNFRDCVVASGNVGGDSDSVAAVAGGIAGSYYGYGAIPREWIDALPELGKLTRFVDRFLDATIGEEE